ncbi:MAG: alpha/beta hydrolase [Rhodopirellula sp.]|nr:alpha/beta hydrolase [Rhodopirellula sp.]
MRNLHRVIAVVAAICFFVLPAAGMSAAEEAAASQAWLISTRHLPACTPSSDAQPDYSVLLEDCQWSPVPAEDFFACDSPQTPTIVLVHGNRVERHEAVAEGLRVYEILKGLAGGAPFRLVVWSWPADQIRGPLRDVRLKAARTDAQGHYLASVLNRLHPDVPLTLIGYSFGSRLVTGSLELLAGGSVAGRSLSDRRDTPQRRIRAILIAAALDSHWLSPGQYHGQALSQVERALVTVNSADPVLKRYHLISRCSNPQALGWSGPTGGACLGGWAEKLDVVDVTCVVGAQHSFFPYLYAPAVMSRLAWYSFLEEPQSAAPIEDPPPVGPALTGESSIEQVPAVGG